MNITTSVLNGLRTTFGQQYAEAYAGTPTWYDKLATTIPSNNRSNTYGWLAQQLRLRPWIGPRVVQNIAEHSYVIQNLPFELTVELSKWDIRDDNLGLFSTQTIPQFAQAVKKHPDQLLAALLVANPLAFDGKALFADDHPTFAAASYTQTYDNNFSAQLDGAGVNTVRAAMQSIIGEDGQPMGIMPRLLIVPPQLQREAEVVANSTTYALPGSPLTGGNGATVDNPMRGSFEILVVPELATAPTIWYMADVSKAIKPFVYQTRDPFDFVARDNPEDESVFERAVFTYGTDGRDNMGVGLPFLISKNVHTPA